MKHSKHWIIGSDTGGTFTDLVALSDAGELRVEKVSSTHPDTELGVIDGVRAMDLSLAQARMFFHATTVATNMAITRTGAKTALITTRGFRDVLELRRVDRADLYDVLWDPPEPLVPRRDRLELDERVDYAGKIVEPLSDDQVAEIGALLLKREIEAIAIVLINAFANPSHEQRVKAILERILPDAVICTSTEILPEPPEFERTATTVANAYLAPGLAGYMNRLSSAAAEDGYEGRFVLVMHNAGGTMTTDYAAGVPVRTLNSGPAGGAVAGAAIARQLDLANVVCLDMGGTSADVSLVMGGEPLWTNDTQAEWGLPIRFPAIEVVSVGAGGGSIAWIDQAGVLKVGPQSAGASPGPACYGRGGTLPTVSDAHIVLGHLGDGSPLGNKVVLNRQLAVDAIASHIATPLGISVNDAAEAILRISDATMARPLRLVTIERGYDPREFSLVAFGGAGPMHAVSLAEELGIPEVIIPAHPGVTSALGVLSVPPVDDFSASIEKALSDVDVDELAQRFAEIESRVRTNLLSHGIDEGDLSVKYFTDLRYVGQLHSLIIPLEAPTAAALKEARSRFDDAHYRQYRYSHPEWSVELATIRVSARGTREATGLAFSADAQSTGLPMHSRAVKFLGSSGWDDCAVVDRGGIVDGEQLVGPVVIDQKDSITLLPPGWTSTRTATGELRIRRSESDG